MVRVRGERKADSIDSLPYFQRQRPLTFPIVTELMSPVPPSSIKLKASITSSLQRIGLSWKGVKWVYGVYGVYGV